jgi:hypothetical protein
MTTAVNPTAIITINASTNPKYLSDSMSLSRLAPSVPARCVPAQTHGKRLRLTIQESLNRV